MIHRENDQWLTLSGRTSVLLVWKTLRNCDSSSGSHQTFWMPAAQIQSLRRTHQYHQHSIFKCLPCTMRVCEKITRVRRCTTACCTREVPLFQVQAERTAVTLAPPVFRNRGSDRAGPSVQMEVRAVGFAFVACGHSFDFPQAFLTSVSPLPSSPVVVSSPRNSPPPAFGPLEFSILRHL